MIQKLFITVLLCLIGSPVTAQERIEGIGKFKIGKTTTAVIPELAKELRTKVVAVNSFFDRNYKVLGKNILELRPNEKVESSPDHTTFCPNVRVFSIGEYTISGIKIEIIHLTFYNDTLVSFYCYRTPELDEALNSKYGKPEEIRNTKTVKCINPTTGAETSIEQADTRQYWHNGPITAMLVDIESIGRNCRKQSNIYFVVGLTKMEETINQCDVEERQRRKLEKRKDLKDF